MDRAGKVGPFGYEPQALPLGGTPKKAQVALNTTNDANELWHLWHIEVPASWPRHYTPNF